MADLPTNSSDRITALRTLPYEEYLLTPWWRLRRHARLKKADGKCEHCGRVTSIADVHHVTPRLGEERDTDLEVLCRDCHNTHHFNQSRQQNMGVYILLARETQRLDHPKSATDFQEAFRDRCKALNLSTADHRFDDAVSVVAKEQPVSLVSAARRAEVVALTKVLPELPPINEREAWAIMRRLHLKFPFRSFPEQYGVGAGVAAIRARAAAKLQAERCPSCRGQEAIISRVSPGFLSCAACHHKWPIPLDSH